MKEQFRELAELFNTEFPEGDCVIADEHDSCRFSRVDWYWCLIENDIFEAYEVKQMKPYILKYGNEFIHGWEDIDANTIFQYLSYYPRPSIAVIGNIKIE